MGAALLLSPVEAYELALQARVELAKRAAARKDVLAWGEALFPHKFYLGFCPQIHDHLIKVRLDKFTVTEAPRGSAKTTIGCFLIPLFQALVEPTSFQHYINVQSTEDKALAINRSIKSELENNDALIRLYGDQRGERWTDGQFVIKNGVIFSCVGAGQSIRGIAYNQIRPDYCMADDLYDHDHIGNPEATRKVNDWFWSDLYKALRQSGHTCMKLTGTAINGEDLLEKLKSKKGVIARTFQTVLDWVKKTVIWPAQKTFAQVMEDRELMPPTIWEREAQNIRRDDSTSLVKLEWLSSWEFQGAWLRQELRKGREPERQARKERLLKLEEVIIGQDPSIGKKQKSDATGTCLTIITSWTDAPGERDYWIMDLREGRLNMDQRVDLLKELIEAQPTDMRVTQQRIEAIGAFDDYATIAQQRTPVRVIRIDHVPDKLTNLENKSIHFSKQRVHINAGLPAKIKQTAVEQLTNNEPPHDDVRDAILLTLGGPRKGPGVWVIE